MADKKSRQIIRQAKQKNSNAIVVATGCYAEVNKQELEKIEELDLIIGNAGKSHLIDVVEAYLKDRINIKELNGETQKNNLKDKIQDIKDKTKTQDINNEINTQENKKIEEEKEFLDFGTVTYTEKTRAVIKVQDGCDNFCSYCIIPYAKGRVRSRKPENVMKEIKEIVKTGIKEVVITGIHVASYGKDFKDGTKLIDLLEQINGIEGLKRIRLGSLEPNLITEEFVNRLENVNKICDHFHLSLQSGCNETLKRMNRKYTVEEFEHGVNLLREKFPNVALTTDIIVGFPGETEEEFNKTYKFLEKIKFSKMHVFKYSMRGGTVAAKMKDQISPEKKEERSKRLIELSNKNEIEFLERYIGKNLEVLFESTIQDSYIRRTYN